MSDIVSDVEKYRRGWVGGLPETPCGFGSKLSETKAQSEWLPKIVAKYKIRSIVDIGAGDLNWISKIDLGCKYTPLDLVPRHPDVTQFDILQAVPPKATMAMCLWVLNHFPLIEAERAYCNILESGCKYLLMTWERRLHGFLDLPAIDSIVIRKRDDERGNVELRLIKC